ncbi:putative Membrane protein [Pseudomonas caricapapayae]|uniref:Putative Membrane protein n=1 Tax=Pseudomonas caricapapayae TaxID=46678 RepID=A0A3M6EG40_9PSED|nr:glycosyltransferase family 39 protein [Pseudomonas caricapapayae]RMV66574.1 putative Membrane protein [Pseudomonas caricapapayae]
MLDTNHSDHPTGWSSARYQRALAVTYFIVLAVWSAGIAFNGAPDESTHFFLLEYLKAFHSLPAASAPTQAFTGTLSGYTWQPGEFWYHGLPFPHVIGALISSYGLSWMLPSDLGYLAARCFNWVLGAVFICALFRIANRAGMPKKAAALAALLIALIPQVSFVFSYFNSDAFGLMSVALLISALLGFLKAPNKLGALCLGGAIGLMFLAKLYLLPALVFTAVMLAAHQFFDSKSLKRYVPTMAVVAAIFSVPMLLVTFLKYGEMSGISGQIDFVALHKNNPAAGYGTCYIGCSGHLVNMENVFPWLSLTLTSYFSTTGWMNIFLPSTYYMGAAVLFILLVTAAAIQTARVYSRDNRRLFLLNYLLPLVMILGLFPSIILLSLLASQNSLPQPQGRYLFVTIPFLALLVAFASMSHARARNSASSARDIRSNRFHLKWLVVVAAWMAWTNMVAWNENTLSPRNIQMSAIGKMVTEAVLASGTGRNSGTDTLSAAQLAERLSTINGEFFIKVPSGQSGAAGTIDEVRKTSEGLLLRGWSVPPATEGSPEYVIAVESGKVLGAIRIEIKRPDVAGALADKTALRSGYEGVIHAASSPDKCDLKLYTVTSTFNIFTMPDVCASISRLSH